MSDELLNMNNTREVIDAYLGACERRHDLVPDGLPADIDQRALREHLDDLRRKAQKSPDPAMAALKAAGSYRM